MEEEHEQQEQGKKTESEKSQHEIPGKCERFLTPFDMGAECEAMWCIYSGTPTGKSKS